MSTYVPDPHDPIWRAVARFASSGAVFGANNPASSASSPAGPAPAFTPRLPAVAVYDTRLTKHVSRYPAVGFPRFLRRLATKCSLSVPVHIYVGAVADACRETSYGDGSLADFDPKTPIYVPGGAAVFIVWDTASSSATASCSATFEQAP